MKNIVIETKTYRARVSKLLAKGKPVQPADVVAMMLPKLMSVAGVILQELADAQGRTTYSDAAGIVVEGDE